MFGNRKHKKIDFVLHCQANKGSDKLWKKNLHKPNIHSVRKRQISTDPDQRPQNMVSDQVLHCLLTEYYIKIGINMKKNPTTHKREMG